jgi:hypothetical protein
MVLISRPFRAFESESQDSKIYSVNKGPNSFAKNYRGTGNAKYDKFDDARDEFS